MGLIEILQDDGDVHVDHDHEVDDDKGHKVDDGYEGEAAVPVGKLRVVRVTGRRLGQWEESIKSIDQWEESI